MTEYAPDILDLTSVWTVGTSTETSWIFDGDESHGGTVGSFMTSGNTTAKRVITQSIKTCIPGDKYQMEGWVRWSSVPLNVNSFGLCVIWFNNGVETSQTYLDIGAGHGANGGWAQITGEVVVPANVNGFKLGARVSASVNTGNVWIDQISFVSKQLQALGSGSARESYYDRFRFVVEDVYGNILTRDMIGMEPQVVRTLSGPCSISLKVHYSEPSVQMPDGSGPIQFRPWAHWIHAVKVDWDGNEKIWASGIVKPSEVDPTSGVLALEAEGFSNYAKGIPWLVNWNPIAVDPFEIVENIWNHLQSYDNGNLGVTVYPTDSGTLMLPGFSFNNEQYVKDFFAIFIREVDRVDCGDYINKLARDIPFDYFEESSWNDTKTGINKSIRLAYPNGGLDQSTLVFRLNENVLTAKQKNEAEIQWVSGLTMKGWFPQKEYYSEFVNADPGRYRRVMDETDVRLDSNERAAAWAHRKLTRRQVPHYYESITIDPYHPNAPFGSFDVGDIITVSGPMAWVGDNVTQRHKVMAMGWDEGKHTLELRLMAEGAFNYDPIEYNP